MNPLKDPEDLSEATALVNQYAQSDWLTLSFSTHGRDRMRERIVPHEVVMETLSRGRCVGFRKEIKFGRAIYSYEMEFRDQYGKVTVVTAIPKLHHLCIVTTYTDQD